MRKPENCGGFVDASLDLGSWSAGELEREAHIVAHIHMRIERIGLEHHRQVALLGRHVVDDLATDGDLARGDILEASDHAQQSGLAASGRTDQHHKLAIAHFERNVVKDADAAIALADMLEFDFRHGRPPSHCNSKARRAPW
ncbi:hypothetical protein FQZ97_1108650 [compost metagenome]